MVRVMTPCSDVVWYQRFGGPCCLYHPEDGGKTPLHDVITQNTTIWICRVNSLGTADCMQKLKQ